MTKTTHKLNDLGIELPIPQTARTIAQKFANQQPTFAKAEQVRLNTLAVLVVNDYLQMMGIPTNLKASDSWNPILQMCGNIADLEIPLLGRLECRNVQSHAQECLIPPETWEERIGYVVVQIDESLQQANILGFIQNVDTELLPLNQLQPLEELIERISQLKTSPIQPLVNLSQWFINQFEVGWQTVESLRELLAINPAYGFRGRITAEEISPHQPQTPTRRAKLIDLGIQIANYPVMLIVEISPESNTKTSIRLQLHPTGNQLYLPEGLKLTVLDESKVVFLEAQARSADNYIQLQFRGDIQERFSVQISLGDMTFTESFMI
ncbi:DUF1822 family protein [Nostoc sp. FACHB-110]|uniref:DUF1822 family protein n=1 Tax=Nostoc sp. FACHB-110 TaxID=2692834 RepID=UPI0016846BCC|nr:DUF1822 family protein [Nostoc sp. FACHB-110]MBD2438327.1 DUF1822 family protein [Nostoc sp. FACHB-110]